MVLNKAMIEHYDILPVNPRQMPCEWPYMTRIVYNSRRMPNLSLDRMHNRKLIMDQIVLPGTPVHMRERLAWAVRTKIPVHPEADIGVWSGLFWPEVNNLKMELSHSNVSDGGYVRVRVVEEGARLRSLELGPLSMGVIPRVEAYRADPEWGWACCVHCLQHAKIADLLSGKCSLVVGPCEPGRPCVDKYRENGKRMACHKDHPIDAHEEVLTASRV